MTHVLLIYIHIYVNPNLHELHHTSYSSPLSTTKITISTHGIHTHNIAKRPYEIPTHEHPNSIFDMSLLPFVSRTPSQGSLMAFACKPSRTMNMPNTFPTWSTCMLPIQVNFSHTKTIYVFTSKPFSIWRLSWPELVPKFNALHVMNTMESLSLSLPVLTSNQPMANVRILNVMWSQIHS